MENETTRSIFHWYVRFDIFAGVMSGHGTVLGREWFVACHEYYDQQAREYPENLQCKYEERWARLRLLAADLSLICSSKSKEEISDEEFQAEWRQLGEEISNWEDSLDPALKDPSKLISDFSGARPRDPDGIVDPYDPQLLYGGDIFFTNYLALDYLSMDIYANYQIPEIFYGTPRSTEAINKAYRMCQLVDALHFYPGSPPDVLLSIQAPIGMAAVFLPQDDRHNMWARRKLADVESLGYVRSQYFGCGETNKRHSYVFPQAFRVRMGSYWNVDVTQWWLPDEESIPPTIRSIHAFITQRTTLPRDKMSADVRAMKGIFTTLCLSDSPSPEHSREASAGQLRRIGSDMSAELAHASSFGPGGAGPGDNGAAMCAESVDWGNSPGQPARWDSF